jgi:hypothetical protein
MSPNDKSIVDIAIPTGGLVCCFIQNSLFKIFYEEIGNDWRERKYYKLLTFNSPVFSYSKVCQR